MRRHLLTAVLGFLLVAFSQTAAAQSTLGTSGLPAGLPFRITPAAGTPIHGALPASQQYLSFAQGQLGTDCNGNDPQLLMSDEASFAPLLTSGETFLDQSTFQLTQGPIIVTPIGSQVSFTIDSSNSSSTPNGQINTCLAAAGDNAIPYVTASSNTVLRFVVLPSTQGSFYITTSEFSSDGTNFYLAIKQPLPGVSGVSEVAFFSNLFPWLFVDAANNVVALPDKPLIPLPGHVTQTPVGGSYVPSGTVVPDVTSGPAAAVALSPGAYTHQVGADNATQPAELSGTATPTTASPTAFPSPTTATSTPTASMDTPTPGSPTPSTPGSSEPTSSPTSTPSPAGTSSPTTPALKQSSNADTGAPSSDWVASPLGTSAPTSAPTSMESSTAGSSSNAPTAAPTSSNDNAPTTAPTSTSTGSFASVTTVTPTAPPTAAPTSAAAAAGASMAGIAAAATLALLVLG